MLPILTKVFFVILFCFAKVNFLAHSGLRYEMTYICDLKIGS